MILLKSLKIWLFTNLSGVILLLASSAFFSSTNLFKNTDYSVVILMLIFGLIYSLPAVPIISLFLLLASKFTNVSSKIAVLIAGLALTVSAVLLVTATLLGIPVLGDDNLLAITWPYIVTAFISIFYVERKSLSEYNEFIEPAKTEARHES